MNSREAILQKLRRQRLPTTPLPGLTRSFVRYPDLLAEFTLALERAAGSLIRVEPRATTRQALLALPSVRAARALCSLVPELETQVALTGPAKSFEPVDLLVLRAEFGVAENGALWISDAGVDQRSVYFLAEHVIALLSARALVHTMHEAYARLEIDRQPFGCFVAGPSKTADIEQALVVGAHGPRSFTVLLDGVEASGA